MILKLWHLKGYLTHCVDNMTCIFSLHTIKNYKTNDAQTTSNPVNKPELIVQWCTWRWRHNGSDSVSNHQPHHCLLNRLFRRRSKKTSKLLVTGLCAGNSPATGEFPAQMASNAENVSIWWRHHDICASKLIIIGLDNGLSPVRHQAICEPLQIYCRLDL